MNLDVAIAELIASVKEPGELKEKAIRDYATSVGFYAESGPTFDPKGTYLCQDCCFRELPHACDLVSGRIRMKIGSCMMWRIGEPVGLKVKHKLSQKEAGYAERPRAKGFGCSRCEYGSEADKPDSAGRKSQCSWWNMHIKPLACCFRESGSDSIDSPGE